MTLDSLITLFAGLGLFVIGIKGAATTMGQVAGRGLRRWVARATRNPLTAALVGLTSGLLTQSTNVMTVILASMIKADMITIGAATPLLAWANVGASVLVMVAAAHLHLFVLAMVALAGFAYYFNLDKSPRLRTLVSMLFSLSLIFFGLELIHNGSDELQSLVWVRDFFQMAAHTVVSALVLGAVAAVLLQSSMTVSVIVVAISSAGLISAQHAALMVFGANIGGGITTYLLGSGIPGRARQLVVLQAAFRISGVLLLLAVYVVAMVVGVNPNGDVLMFLGHNSTNFVGVSYLACQASAAATQMLFYRPLTALAEWLQPPSVEDNLSQPQFLYPEAISEPETALVLVDREQARLFHYLILSFGIAVHDTPVEAALPRNSVRAVAFTLGEAISAFMDDLAETETGRDLRERAADRRSCNVLLLALHETIDELAIALAGPFDSDTVRSLSSNITEGLGGLLLAAEDALRTRAPDDVAILTTLASDRSALVDNLRRRVMAAEGGLSGPDQNRVYTITNLLERTVWMLRRYAGLLTEQVVKETTEHTVAQGAARPMHPAEQEPVVAG